MSCPTGIATRQDSPPIPLCETTASGWIDALLLEERASRREAFAVILRDDPLLLWWTASHYDQTAVNSTGDVGPTIGDCADWLTDYGSTIFAMRENPAAEATETDWCRLVQSALFTAQLFEAAATYTGSFDPEMAYLFAATETVRSGLTDTAPQDATHSELFANWPRIQLAAEQTDFNTTASQLELSEATVISASKRSIRLAKQWRPAALKVGAELIKLRLLCAKLSRLENLEQNFERTLRREKLDAMKELAYGAGHEINNPLANISTRAQTMLRDETDSERRRMLATINRQAFRAHEMITDLMLFARPPEIEPEEFDLDSIIETIISEVQEAAASQSTTIQFDHHTSPLLLLADKTQVAVVLRAMLDNGLNAIGCGGNVTITSEPRFVPSASDSDLGGSDEFVRITIRDTGPGMDERERRHLFDPFFSGREAGRGLGFGLSKCWRIVTRHHGWIDVESSPGAGSCFAIHFPRRFEPPSGD